jgi:hypothetical protein
MSWQAISARSYLHLAVAAADATAGTLVGAARVVVVLVVAVIAGRSSVEAR